MGWEVPGIKNWIKTNLKGGNQKGKVTGGLKMLGGWGGGWGVKSQGNFEDDSQREKKTPSKAEHLWMCLQTSCSSAEGMRGAAGTARRTGPGEERVRMDETGIPEGPSGRGEETRRRERKQQSCR